MSTATKEAPRGTLNVQDLPITSLRMSETNTRGRDDWKTEDLIASIRQNGILVPLLVRAIAAKSKTPGHWEVIAGHRRLQAAQSIQLAHVPCIIVEADDELANTIQVVENLQRVDLHPYDEALGMKQLIQRGRSIEDLQKMLGKPWRYVRDRLKLLELCQPAALYLRSGELPLSHALLIAELPEPRQRQLVLKKDNGTHGAVWQPDEDVQTSMNGNDKLHGNLLRPISLNALRNWIDDHVRFNAKECEAEVLFPETVKAIATAEKADLKIVMITFDHFVQIDARDAKGQRTYGPRSWKKIGEKTCSHEVLGVVAAGPERGTSFLVCVEKKKCKIHWGSEIRATRKDAKDRVKQDGKDSWKKEAEQRAAREKKQEEIRAAWRKAQPKLEELLAEKLKTAALDTVWKIVGYTWRTDRGSLLPQGATFESRMRFLAGCVLKSRLTDYWIPENGPKLCRVFGIDWSKVVELPEHAKRKEGGPRTEKKNRGTKATASGSSKKGK